MREYSRRRPRAYGSILFLVGLGLAWAAHLVEVPAFVFLLCLGAAGFGLTGLVYLMLGRDMNRLGSWFEDPSGPLGISGKSLAVGAALSPLLLAVTGLLYWLLRS